MKPRLEIGVDHAGGLRRGVADVDRPGAHFLRAGGEVGLQAEQLVARRGSGGSGPARSCPCRRGTPACPRRRGRRSRPRSRRRSRPPARLLLCGVARARASSSGLFSKPCSATLATYIAGLAVSRNSGLQHRLLLRRRGRACAPGCACVERRLAPSRARRPARCASLSPGSRDLARTRASCLLDRREVGERQLGLDHLDVARSGRPCRRRG